MNSNRVTMREEPIDVLAVPVNNEVRPPETALDIRVQPYEPRRVNGDAGAVPEGSAKLLQ